MSKVIIYGAQDNNSSWHFLIACYMTTLFRSLCLCQLIYLLLSHPKVAQLRPWGGGHRDLRLAWVPVAAAGQAHTCTKGLWPRSLLPYPVDWQPRSWRKKNAEMRVNLVSFPLASLLWAPPVLFFIQNASFINPTGCLPERPGSSLFKCILSSLEGRLHKYCKSIWKIYETNSPEYNGLISHNK